MAQVKIYAIANTRFNDEPAKPGDEFTVSDEEVGNILSSGRFSTDKPKPPEKKEAAPK